MLAEPGEGLDGFFGREIGPGLEEEETERKA